MSEENNGIEVFIDTIKNDGSIKTNGVFRLLANQQINNNNNSSNTTACEWIKLKSISVNDSSYSYVIPHYCDYYSSFQIINDNYNGKPITIKLYGCGLLIGSYELSEKNNNILPVYGSVGLMVGAVLYGAFTFESPAPVTINALATFCGDVNMNSVRNKLKTQFRFIGSHGDVFDIIEGFLIKRNIE